MKYYIKTIIFFNFYISLYVSDYCPKLKPIRYNNGECQIKKCTQEEFENKICIISNEKAKIQWLNNIIVNNDNNKEEIYFNLGVTIHNKEIILSSYCNNNGNNNTIFFYNNNNSNELETLNKINNIYCHQNAEFSYLSVKIINKQDDYYVLICCENSCNLFNYNNNEILNFIPHNSSISKSSFRNSLIKLDNFNYFYAIVTGSGIKNNNHISISKFNFSFNEINNSIEVNLESKFYEKEIINKNTIITCFQTENNLIECMTVNLDNYLYVYIFDESLNLKDKIILETNLIFNEIFNCIHLQKEIGIYYYYYEVNDGFAPEFKIKNLIYNETQNVYQLIDILNCSNINIIDINVYCFDNIEIIKITNTKFIIMYHTFTEEFHVILCDFYGKNDSLSNLIARYYKIPLELYNINEPINPKGFKYENIIGLSMIETNSIFIILFGSNNISQSDNIEYINDINNINNDNLYYIINLNDYLNSNIKINNNLFGYEFIGLKIVTITGLSYGIKYYLNNINNNNIIKENDIIKMKDLIIIDFSNAEVKIDNEFYLEMTQIIGEPEYDESNSYADEIKTYGNEDYKNYFQRYIFEGSSLKIKYNFGCYKNCYNCEYVGFTLDNQKCLSCKNNEELCYMNNTNNCFNVNSLTYNYYKEDGNLICVPLNSLCPEDYPFEDRITKECKKILNFDDLILEKHIYANTKTAIDKVVQLIYEEIKNNKLNTSENYLLNTDGTIFQITSPENQKYYINNSLYTNISTIDLNECADILKKENNIKDQLIIVKLDIKRNDTPSTQVEYEVYNPYNLQKLNLSICDNIKIDIYAPVILDKDYLELIKQLKEQGYDIFNPEDSFYNDICSIYNSQNNTDVIIKDRKNDFYNPNLFLCEDTCEYKSFDINTSKVNCKCTIKQDINSNIYETKFSPNTLLNNFFDFDKYTNYKVLKCYNMVFNFERIKINKGSYIVSFLIISFVTYMTINFFTQSVQYRKILDDIIYINKITDKKLKLKRENNENNENNNSYTLKDINMNIKKENVNPVEGIIKRRKYKLKTITSNNKDKRIKFMINNKVIDNKENKKIYLRRNKSNKNLTHFDITDKKKKLPTIYDCDNDDINRNMIFRKTKKSSNESNDTNIFSRSSRKQIFNNASSNEKFNNSKNRLRFSHRIKKSKKNVSFFNDIINKNKNSTERTIISNERINKIIEILPKNERYVYFIDNELNELEYIYAINIDFRTLFQYYWSLLKQIHPLFFTFIAKHDYNLFLIKLSLFVFSIALNITLNTLFFSDESMHKLYEDYGKLNYIYNLPKSIYSVLFSGLISFFFELLSLSENEFSKFKEKGIIKDFDKEKNEQIQHLKLKSILFFIVGTSLLIFFWYYISCFCAVYSNAQMSLIKDTFISFIIELTYPFLFALISTIIRIQGLRKKNRCLYNFSKIVSFIINLI